jgi:hypothetical protein
VVALNRRLCSENAKFIFAEYALSAVHNEELVRGGSSRPVPRETGLCYNQVL